MSRRRAFIVVTVIFGLGLGTAGFGFLSLVGGWFGAGGREEHRVHDLAYGALAGLLIALPFLIQAVRPERKPAVMQGAVAGGAGFAAGYVLGGSALFALAPVVVVAVLWWLHPARDRLSRLGGRPDVIMAAIAVLAAIPLVMYALDQAAIQRACVDGDQHCEEFHYAGMAALAYALPLVGLVASFRTPGWLITARLVSAAAAVFGLSAVLFPDLPSSVGTMWGFVVLAGAVLFLGVAEWGARKEVPEPPR